MFIYNFILKKRGIIIKKSIMFTIFSQHFHTKLFFFFLRGLIPNYRLKVFISFNLKLLIKLFFCPSISTHNNLSRRIYC